MKQITKALALLICVSMVSAGVAATSGVAKPRHARQATKTAMEPLRMGAIVMVRLGSASQTAPDARFRISPQLTDQTQIHQAVVPLAQEVAHLNEHVLGGHQRTTISLTETQHGVVKCVAWIDQAQIVRRVRKNRVHRFGVPYR